MVAAKASLYPLRIKISRGDYMPPLNVSTKQERKRMSNKSLAKEALQAILKKLYPFERVYVYAIEAYIHELELSQIKGSNCDDCIETALRNAKHRKIGKAIMRMSRWERFWWGLTGRSKFMERSYWEKR